MKWSLPTLSELTSITFNIELTHLGSETSKYLISKILTYWMDIQKLKNVELSMHFQYIK